MSITQENVVLKFVLLSDQYNREVDKATAKTEQLEQAGQKTEKQVVGLGGKLGNLGKIAASALAAGVITAFIAGVSRALVRYSEFADEQIKLERDLLNSLNNRIDVQERLIRQAEELQGSTLFGDEETIEAQTRLAQALGNNETVLTTLTPLVQDYATFTGVDLDQATKDVTDAITGEGKALRELGIELDGTERSVQRFESVSRGLSQTVGGEANRAFEDGLGAATSLGNALRDLGETVGRIFIPAVNAISSIIKPAVDGLTNFLTVNKSVEDQLRDEQREFNATIQALQNLNIDQEARRRLIVEINREYGDYLPNLIDEKDTIEDIQQAQEAANRAFGQRILLAAFEEDIRKIVEENKQAILGQVDAAKDLVDAQDQLIQQGEDGAPVINTDALEAGLGDVADASDEYIDKQGEVIDSFDDRVEAVKQRFREIAEELGLGDFDEFLARSKAAGIKAGELLSEGVEPDTEVLDRFAQQYIQRIEGIINFILDERAKLDSIQFITPRLDAEDALEDLILQFETVFEQSPDNPVAKAFFMALNGEEPEVEIKPVKIRTQGGEADGVFAFDNDELDTLIRSLDLAQRAIDNYYDNLINRIDQTIDKQEQRVNRFSRLAEQGNAEQLQLEEERLQRLIEKRERFVNRQRALDAIQIASSQAVALAGAIRTIFDPTQGVTVFDRVAAAFVGLASIGGLVGGISSAFADLDTFHEGVEFLDKGLNVGNNELIIKAEKGERIIDKNTNRQLAGFSNEQIRDIVLGYRESPTERIAVRGESRELLNEMKKYNATLEKYIKKNKGVPTEIFIDENGIAAMGEKVKIRQAKRKYLAR